MATASEVDQRCDRAVRLRETGTSWARIAQQLGCDSANLRRQCVARGYTELPRGERRAQLAQVWGQVAMLAARETRDAIIEGKISPSQMAVQGGIATDKAIKLEGWDKGDQGDESFLGRLGQVLLEGGEVSMAVSRPVTVEAEAIASCADESSE